MKSLLLVAGLVCAAVPAAATTYTFENVQLAPGSVATSFPTTTITISDAAVQRGHFSLFARTGPVTIGGDVSDFVSFASAGTVIDRTGIAPYYSLLIDLTFRLDGSVSAARVNYSGISPAIDLTGSGDQMTGLYSPTDNPTCGTSTDCRVLDAQLVALPAAVAEPSTAPLIATGILALMLWRCRRRFLKTA